jgi:large subunit ribosomal protein L23
MDNLYSLIDRPVVTERATNLKASNQYVFRVALNASKRDIKLAIEKLFKVKVLGVNTMRVAGKFRRLGSSPGNHRADWKKAIVTLPAGQEIKFIEDAP